MSYAIHLSTKGQLILPKDIRERHGWTAGTQFEVIEGNDSVVLRPMEHLPESTLEEIVGSTGYHGPARSLEEMDEAIEKEARRRWR